MMATRLNTAPLAVVAGASGAIGQAVVEALRDAGWAVLGTYRSAQPKQQLGIDWVHFDGAWTTGTEALREALAANIRPLRAVICCLGSPSSKRPVATTDADEFDAVYAANVTSIVRLWHVIYERARQAAASVVLLSSDTTAALHAGNGAYSAAKAGLEALATTLAAEEAPHDVRVNVLAPSLVDSPLAETVMNLKGVSDPAAYYRSLPWGRPLESSEVAAVAVEIASAPHWRYASGQVVRLAVRGSR